MSILASTETVSLPLCYVYRHMKHVLEQSSTFPYIAWAAIIAFGSMTVMLAIQLDEEMTHLSSNREYLETMLAETPD